MKNQFLLLLFAAVVAGCSALQPSAEPSQPVSAADITDPADPLEVNVGETFTIVIKSNPSTGYHWELVGDLAGVEFVALDYKADEPVLMGSGGVDIWTFKALTAGESTITLGSYPPGITDGAPEQTVEFTVIVR